ncbi:DNA primase large subunit [Silurus asotus]|uniref:DNA primase large subunit n=1 Tax=Silurus asotus TaxID=30991 RepID=A0AAD5AL52_SILAS|nr:DNA primase large subunit [Silurus asotus]
MNVLYAHETFVCNMACLVQQLIVIMQFLGRRKKVTLNQQNELYGHCLQFYCQPPLENISLTEFECFAVDRLKLLKAVENLGVSYVKVTEQYKKKLHAEFSSLGFPHREEVDDTSSNKNQAGPTEYEKRRKDHISHFILRLAYCQTEDLRRWFIQQEMDLFRYRFNELSPKYKTDFLHKNNLKYETINADEKNNLKEQLINSSYAVSGITILEQDFYKVRLTAAHFSKYNETINADEKNNLKEQLINSSYAVSGITILEQDFYKVPFQDALDLVRTRKVFLKGGYAYIPHQDIVAIVLNDFRTKLSKALALLAVWEPSTAEMINTFEKSAEPTEREGCPLGTAAQVHPAFFFFSFFIGHAPSLPTITLLFFSHALRLLHLQVKVKSYSLLNLLFEFTRVSHRMIEPLNILDDVKSGINTPNLTARSLPAVQSDERLQPLLNHLSHAYVGQDYSIQKNIGKVSLDQIDPLSSKSFPLCMRQLHKSLRENHHLRHGGRMQYGLFLKGIGITLDQALQFWRSEFIKGKVDTDKFDKAYAYSIRHMFGKEGKRTDYTPYSCMKVILSNPPSQGDYHGCPFRHSDPELLKQKLQSYKLSPGGIMQILDLVKGMHYQLACQKYFELTHNIDDAGFSLNHPNQYFMESRKLLGGGKEVKKEAEMPQRGQENTISNGPSVPPPPQANTTQAVDDMGDLDSYFLDE